MPNCLMSCLLHFFKLKLQVLTLRAGEMTTGRRSSPVPQLSCVGGSGSGRGWEPAVVQCYNRGWDGREVQWECNSDMEGTVRFGKVEVVCEGYDYAEDDFILAGSCGLEYTLELTKEGKQSRGGGWSSGQSNNYNSYGSNSHNYNKTSSDWSGLGDLIVLAVICIMIYAFYKTCIDSPSMEDTQYSGTNTGDYPSGGGSPGAGGWADPNRGYGENVHGFGNNQGGADCGGGARRRGTGAAGAGGGFWTGAATGSKKKYYDKKKRKIILLTKLKVILLYQVVFWATCLATEILDIIEATEATTEAGAEEATVEASPGREDPGPGDPGPHLPPRGPGLLQDSEAPGEDENYTIVDIKCVCV